MSSWHSTEFGENLVTKSGTVPVKSYKPLTEAEVVGIYFSAHWCPPCRGFTPVLAEAYKQCKAEGKKLEVVFASSDRDAAACSSYFAEQPWTCLPYADRKLKDKLSKKYGVRGIPTLVLLDGQTGEVMTKEGRAPLAKFGAAAFPFTAAAVAGAEAEAKRAKEKGLVALKDLLAKTAAGAAALGQGAAHILFWFSKANDRGSDAVQPKIAAVREGCGQKLAVLHVPFPGDANHAAWSARQAKDGVPCLTVAELEADGGALWAAFKAVFAPEAPHVAVVGGDASTLVHEDCVRELYGSGARGYPWTKDRMDELKAEAEALKAGIKAQIDEGAAGLPFLGKTLLTKDGPKARADVLNADVVGVYFSAHWCGPCRGFTPKLASVYKDIKAQQAAGGKTLEVVFVSSDQDEDAFKSYFGEQPWLAMPFDDRDRKEALGDALGVRGIPSLQFFNGKTGKLLTASGRGLVGQGAAKFPWGML